MTRRRQKRSRTRASLDSGFAKPVGALVLLGLLYLAFQVGLLQMIAEAILAPLKPE